MPVIEDEVRGIVASRAQLFAWAEVAKPGDRIVYATRSHLPPGSDGARAARELAQAKLVGPRQKRSDMHAGEWVYYLIRLDAPWATPEVAPQQPERPVLKLTAAAHDALDTEAGDALLPYLERAAAFGRPCPTDKQLAAKAKIAASRVQDGLAALRGMGKIAVHAAPAPTLRFVTILATGQRTGVAA